jgi:hypothetical protein
MVLEKFPNNIFESTESTAYFNRLVDHILNLETRIVALESSLRSVQLDVSTEIRINKNLSTILNQILMEKK